MLAKALVNHVTWRPGNHQHYMHVAFLRSERRVRETKTTIIKLY